MRIYRSKFFYLIYKYLLENISGGHTEASKLKKYNKANKKIKLEQRFF